MIPEVCSGVLGGGGLAAAALCSLTSSGEIEEYGESVASEVEFGRNMY